MSAQRRDMDKSLRDQYDDEVAENTPLKTQVQEIQKKYLNQAEDRLEAQRTLFHILNLIQKSEWRHSKDNDKKETDELVDEAFKLSKECESRARTLMDQLEEFAERDMRTNKAEAQEAMNDLSASSQLEENLGKFKRQNNQLKRDIKNRQIHLEGETKIKQDFQTATKKVVAMIKAKCNDKALVEQVVKAAAATT